MPLWAVHLSDGILEPSWQLIGFAVAGLLFVLGAWRMPEDDIPPTALLAAVFFVASSFHISLGPSSVHLLLNGLVGVILGRRATLAISVGLFLQAALMSHGGFGTLGINICIMTFPALAAAGLFRLLQGRFSGLLIGAATLIGLTSLVFSVVLLASNRPSLSFANFTLTSNRSADIPTQLDLEPATQVLLRPLMLSGILLASVIAGFLGRRRSVTPEFAVGLLLGLLTVLLTLLLNALVLITSGEAQWQTLAILLFVMHLPIAVLEGIVLGFSISFLARVKPELLGLTQSTSLSGETACVRVPS